MSNNEGFNQFRMGMGLMAESLRMFNAELLRNGFTREEAMRLTEVFLKETISTANNKEDN